MTVHRRNPMRICGRWKHPKSGGTLWEKYFRLINLVLCCIEIWIYVFLLKFLSLKYYSDFPAFRYWESILVWCGVKNIYCYRQVIFEMRILVSFSFSCVTFYLVHLMFLNDNIFTVFCRILSSFSIEICIIFAHIT